MGSTSQCLRSSRVLAFHLVCFVAMALRIYSSDIDGTYTMRRDQLLSRERQRRLGGQLTLSADEQFVSDLLIQEKKKMVVESRYNRTAYIPSLTFFHSKPKINNSLLLKLIQRMPKGAALHLHDISATSVDWLVMNATYRDNIYMCLRADGFIYFSAFQSPPSNADCAWKLVKKERAMAHDVDEFDQMLKNNLSMMTTDPQATYADNAQVWLRFVKYFRQVQKLVYYKPVFRDYFWRMLDEFRADNVQYIELRSTLAGIYDLNGTVYDAEYAVQIYKDTIAQFVNVYPDFSGAKIIMSGYRNSKYEVILGEVQTAIELNRKYPDVMVGYDLVGNEAYFNTLLFYLDALLYPTTLNPPYKLHYFLHVGETNWQGTQVDDNMMDAILLNVTRISHGFALPKRPKLLQMVKERGIALEINPLSSQVLQLVTDLRNHPMIPLIADNYPIIISSDDIAVWGALPLSHDIYMAFTDMCGEEDGLTFLKQLAINSIKYSAMTGQEILTAMNLWQQKWNKFIKDVVAEHSSPPDDKPKLSPGGDGATLAPSCFLFLLVAAILLFEM